MVYGAFVSSEVGSDYVVLADGSRLPCGMVVWSTGLAPRDLTRSLDVVKNKSGQIITDSYCQVKGAGEATVFAIGDCADVEDLGLPCTAQVRHPCNLDFCPIFSSFVNM